MPDFLQPHGLQHANHPCWSLFKFMSIESVMPSNHLILCHPLLLLPSIFPSIRVFSNESLLRIRWSQYWSFSISPVNEYLGLTSFKIDWPVSGISLCPRDSQESSPAPQFESINSSVLNLFYGPTLSSIHDYRKNHSFDYTHLCQQSDLSAFYYVCHSSFPLQSLFTVILELKKIKPLTVATFSPSVCHGVMGLDAMIFVFLMLSFKPAF